MAGLRHLRNCAKREARRRIEARRRQPAIAPAPDSPDAKDDPYHQSLREKAQKMFAKTKDINS